MAGERTKIRILRPKNEKKISGEEAVPPPQTPLPMGRGTRPPHNPSPYTLGADPCVFGARLAPLQTQILDAALLSLPPKLPLPKNSGWLWLSCVTSMI